MMSIEKVLQRILSEPSPDDLWQLHPYLLALNSPQADAACDLARAFYSYLSCVRSKLTSKQYSLWAAALSAGSVGVIAVQDIVQAVREDRERAIRNLLAGGLVEMLEMASTFQHVKAWETEFVSVHEETVWYLYETLWRLSVETQPDLAVEKRQVLIEMLLAGARTSDVSGGARMAMIVRLFQILLAIRLVPLFSHVNATS
jgi:hypothetical protein